MAFESRNPATGELIATYPEHTSAEVEQRLQQAWDGWKRWAKTSVEDRKAFLVRLAELLEERAEQYGALIVSEMGKPLGEAIGEVKKSAFGARHFAGDGSAYVAEEAIAGTPGRIVYQPIGPVLAIMPWNLPFWQVLRFFIPQALIGNTVVVKHAETVQGCALAIEQLVRDAGGPEGLYVNLSVKTDAVPAVIADGRLRAVTVTGSVRAGRAVAELAGKAGKKVVLELGGSDPFVVLEDADLEKAVKMGVMSRYSNNAQSCIAAKRFLVSEKVMDAFTDAFVKAAEGLKMGDPMAAETKLGPQAREDLRANTERQVAEAVKAGGKVLTGGKSSEGPGYFYPPTVIAGLAHDAAVAREEFFGPVALIFPFRDEAEAVRLANDTEYGLAATVFSKDLERARRVAEQIECGAVFLNDFVRSDPRAPFGGMKGSGVGRELGALGARELANAKVIWEG